MKNRVLLTLCLFFCFCVHSASAAERPTVGGPCAYDKFIGNCSVTSVDDAARLSYFTYAGAVRKKRVEFGNNAADRIIPVGTSAPCSLEIINKGTCTPCILSGDKISGSCSKEAYSAIFPSTGK